MARVAESTFSIALSIAVLVVTTTSPWTSPSDAPVLAPDAVHVWRAPLDVDDARRARLADVLSPDEHARAARFRFDRDRRRFVAARGRLRLLLSRYLDQVPESIAFAYGTQGKPSVPSLAFNVSHAGDLALYAFARSRRVGVDVEPVRPLDDADRIVDRFFSALETAAYRALPDAARAAAFVTCWTRKEAFIKALGEGLSHPLDAFDVTVRADEPARLLATRRETVAAAQWAMQAVPVGAGYAATVAADGPPWHLVCFDVTAFDATYAEAARSLASDLTP